MPNELFVKNRKKLVDCFNPDEMAVICPAGISPRNGNQPYRYRQSSNLLYLTGVQQEDTYLLLYPGSSKKEWREILFIRYVSEEEITWEGPKLSKKEASELTGIKNVQWTKDIWDIIHEIICTPTGIYLEMGEEWPPKKSPSSLSYTFAREMEEKFPSKRYEKVVPLIYRLRTVKEKEEIAMMKEAVEVTNKAFRHILTVVEPGLFEYDIEAEITGYFTKNKRSPHSYLPIVAGGNNANVLHYNNNESVLKKGDLLLLDFGAENNGYASDLSRTIPVSGKFSKRQKEVYSSVLRILKQAKMLMIPGNTIEKLNLEVGKMMEEEMVRLKLLKLSDIKKQDNIRPLYKKYYPHGISHFMGLDVHDCGTRETPFEKGMVLSCEPGIYIPEEGFGIRLENDILVDKKPVDLMEKIPIEMEEIEELMK